MAKTVPINIANPDGVQDPPRLGHADIVALAQAVAEYMDTDHFMGDLTDGQYTSDDAGKHRKITFRESYDPDPPLMGLDDVGQLFIGVDDADLDEVSFFDALGNTVQVTSGGLNGMVLSNLGDTIDDSDDVVVTSDVVYDYVQSLT